MSSEMERLERDLVALVSRSTAIFSTAELAEAHKFIDVGEYGLALESLVAMFRGTGQQMPNDVAEAVRKLALQMEIDPSRLIDGTWSWFAD